MPYPCGHEYNDLQCDGCRRLEQKARVDPRYAALMHKAGFRPPPALDVTLIPCASCGDGKTKFKASAAMPAEAVAKLIAGPRPAVPWPVGWQGWPGARAAQLDALNAAAAAAHRLEYPAGRFEGRGIVIPAGGASTRIYGPDPIPYFLCAYAAAFTLRRRGCTLPIQFWFLAGELEPWMEDQARALAVECVDAGANGVQAQMRCPGGWQLKVHAVLNCPFAEVLHLDADVVATADPAYLFEDPNYLEHGALFWGDNPGHHTGRLTGEQADAVGMPWLSGELDFDTGQFLVDKARCWAALHVVKHLADHADFWGGFNADGQVSLWYGDKTDFHVGYRKAGKDYHVHGPFSWNHAGGFYQHRDSGGRLLFQHASHAKGKLAKGEPIPELVGAATAAEAVRFRGAVPWGGTLEEAARLVSPERFFEVGPGHGRETWMDVVLRNEYRLPDRFDPTDVVVDVGANVGAFSYACLRRGAGFVVWVEPHRPSAERLRHNLRPFEKAGAGYRLHGFQMAAWSRSGADRLPMHLEPRHGVDHTGGYSLARHLAAPVVDAVPTVSLDEVIVAAAGNGPVRLLKLDCEGAEYPALYACTRLGQVQEIVGEWHAGASPEAAGFAADTSPAWTPLGLRDFLEAQGFAVELEGDPEGELGHFFARRRL